MSVLLSAQQWLDQNGTNGTAPGLSELLWYQRYTKVLDLTPGMAIQSKLAGTYLAKSKGRGMEFDEVRHYQSGDDVRTIDWRVTARTGKVHTKLFREEKERPVFILTDLGNSMRFGSTLLFKSVQAAHLAALIAWHVKQRGDKLGGLVFSQQQHVELKPQSRSHGVLRYFHALTAVHENTDSSRGLNINEALSQLRRLVRPGSMVYILSDFTDFNQHGLRHIRAIRQHNEVTCCAITDPLDLMLPETSKGLAAVSDGANTGYLELGSQALKQRYANQQHAFQQQLQLHISQLGCKWLPVSAAEPVLSQLERKWYG
ncbi:DUF58 domain-containing protein [Rheinheimera maricola]|uniref:DUF58 domain-containing protein n=1 Tax=Rheinheimera maricola TaxID=2793282 RepID=A0ABS7XA83_9GAMM|nr:DUF58 domain-containing protein [Rheinheimera maricola]MBZ9611697.1 DUF58 domain-containing protein [Rheinheimera maricola]